jgi:hypothetical protein
VAREADPPGERDDEGRPEAGDQQQEHAHRAVGDQVGEEAQAGVRTATRRPVGALFGARRLAATALVAGAVAPPCAPGLFQVVVPAISHPVALFARLTPQGLIPIMDGPQADSYARHARL